MQLNTLYTISTMLTICVTLITLGGIVGGIFAFIKSRKSGTMEAQNTTIVALQQQVTTLTGRIDNLERDKERQSHIIETIQQALKQKGILVTIDGDLVTISDGSGSSSSMIRKRAHLQKRDGAAAIAKES